MYDVIVIGSGPGGAITTHHLCEKGYKVLLLEAGKNLSLKSTPEFSIQEMLSKYWNGGTTVTLGQPKLSFVMGKCKGGGSEVNSGLYHRIPDEVISEWERDYKVKGIAKDELLPHYEACERAVNVSLMPEGTVPESSFVLKNGADALGWKCFEVPRWYKYNKQGEAIKQSMTETYLKSNSENKPFIEYEIEVKKIERNGSHWSVMSWCGKKFSAKKVFVCAGAIQTPSILMRSGIKKNIGKNLQFHPSLKVAAKFKNKINKKEYGVPVHQVKEFYPASSMGCSISSLPYIALMLSDFPSYAKYAEENWEFMSIYYTMIRTTSCARVVNLPFTKDPLITYQLNDEDFHKLKESLRSLCLLLFKAGAEKLIPSLTEEKFIMDSEEDLEKVFSSLPNKLLQLMTIHLFGSCPMGENKSRCATNSYGKVFDYEGLYINDASLLCSSMGVNPQGGLMAIARRNILKFLEEENV